MTKRTIESLTKKQDLKQNIILGRTCQKCERISNTKEQKTNLPTDTPDNKKPKLTPLTKRTLN